MLHYQVDGSGTGAAGTRLEAGDMFHVRGFGEGPVGLNVMAYAAESIGQARAIQLFGSSFFGSGAQPSGVVELKKPLTPEGLQDLEIRFSKRHRGVRNSQKTLFLDNEMTFKPMSTNPDESQFVESAQHMVPEICRWFGVPPHKVQHLLNATFSNIEHQSIEVVQDSILPWVRRFEDEANYKLFGANDRLHSRMDLTDLLRGDTASRTAYYRTMREIGVFSVNDILRAEDRPTIAEAWADEHPQQSQYAPVRKLGEMTTTQPAPGRPAALEPASARKRKAA